MPDGYIGLDEMGGVRVTKYMWMDVLLHAKSQYGFSQHTLNTRVAHMRLGVAGVFAVIMAQSRKEPLWVPVGFVISTQRLQRDHRQHHQTIHCAFAEVDMHHRTIRENITDLQGGCFPKAQAKGIQSHIECPALKCRQMIDDTSDFLTTQNGGQCLITLEMHLVQNRPRPDQGTGEEMLMPL